MFTIISGRVSRAQKNEDMRCEDTLTHVDAVAFCAFGIDKLIR